MRFMVNGAAGVGRAIGVWAALALSAAPALANPAPRGIGFLPSATQSAAEIHQFHNFILIIITAITVLVLALLFWVMVRYNRRANPEPKRFTHNAVVEVVWTVVPVLILVAIATQSFPLLAREERVPPGDVTIKAIGNSWFWQHEYQDYGVTITSNMLSREDAAAAGKPALFGVDEPILVPVGKTVRLLVTSNDVIHSWAMPQFGVKEDAVPGRLNEGWFKVEREGTYYGQCSELCGIRHAFMPIEVRAVPQAEFEAWIVSQGGQMAMAEPAPAAAPAAPAAETPPAAEPAPATATPTAAPADLR